MTDDKIRKPGQFAPGHKYLPPAGGAAPVGKDNHVRRANRMLSIVLRERLPPELIADHLYAIACGQDPMAQSTPGGALNQVPIDMTTRLRAWKIILDRMYGQPAQHVHMEAEVRAAVGVVRATVEPGAVRSVPTADLNAFRSTLSAMLGAVGIGQPTSSPVAVAYGRPSAPAVLDVTPSETVPDEEPPPDGEPSA